MFWHSNYLLGYSVPFNSSIKQIIKIVKRNKRRILNNTGECNCEICNVQTFLVQHHIRGRDVNRANEHDNLINICSNCHTLIHRGEIIIENRVLTTQGYMVLWHNKHEQSITGNDADVHVY